METTETTPVIIELNSVVQLRENNRKVIVEKATNAMAALSKIKTIENDEDDEYANNVLVKCNSTLPIIEGLRKEYTSKFDAFKAQEMEIENKFKKEMERAKAARNAYAKQKADAADKTRREIEQKRMHDLHYEECKAELVGYVQMSLSDRIANGEKAISNMLNTATLETIAQVEERLKALQPKLNPDLIKGWFDGFGQDNFVGIQGFKVDYTLVTKEEIAALVERARNHEKFEYKNLSAAYATLVNETRNKWLARIPEYKERLTELAKAKDEEAKAKAKQALAEQRKKDQDNIDGTLAAKKEVITKAAEEKKAQAATDTDFNAQIASQGVKDQSGTRKKIVYRFTNEDALINEPMEAATILHAAMLHLFVDKSWLGIYKRNKDNFIQKDKETGLPIYEDFITDILKELAKLKPAPNIPGLTITEDIAAISTNKKSKE